MISKHHNLCYLRDNMSGIGEGPSQPPEREKELSRLLTDTILIFINCDNFSKRARVFLPVQCSGCLSQFDRECELIHHLNQNEECMTAMGGTVDSAKKLLKRAKDSERNRFSSARTDRYHKNPEPEKQAAKKNYWENPEARIEAFNTRYHNVPQDALVKLSKAGRYGPSFPCVVCQELHWLSNVSVLKEEDMNVDFV